MDGTVLIADDDRTIRTVLTQALTRACQNRSNGAIIICNQYGTVHLLRSFRGRRHGQRHSKNCAPRNGIHRNPSPVIRNNF